MSIENPTRALVLVSFKDGRKVHKTIDSIDIPSGVCVEDVATDYAKDNKVVIEDIYQRSDHYTIYATEE